MDIEQEFEEMSSYEAPESDASEPVMEKLLRKILNGKHVVLYGPPGTGKTRLLSQITSAAELDIGVIDFVQFHAQYSYQDFIEGYSVAEGVFHYKRGVFLNFIDAINEALGAKQKNIFVIDEINRADISSVFGELLTFLDDRKNKKVTLPASQRSLSVEEDFSIIGTMNSADKNISIMDFALRRRFDFIFVPPDYKGMAEWLNQSGFAFDEFSIEDYVNFAKTLNQRIIINPLLGKNMTLGQALFVPTQRELGPIQLSEICEMIQDKVVPQIEAYLGVGNHADLSKILSPTIRQKVENGADVTNDDVISLILSILPSEQ